MPTSTRFIRSDGGFERVVEKGDTLSGIARERGLTVDDILATNPEYRANPDLIHPGQTVRFGATSSAPGSDLPEAPATPQASSASPVDSFNVLLSDLLKSAQGVNTDELLKRRRALQRASIGKEIEITPEEFRTLSPSQQEAIRSGRTVALEPDIDENAFQIKKAETAITNFEKMYTEAQKFGDEFAEKMVAPEQVINSYKLAIESNPSMMATILSGANDKTRQAVMSSLDYTKLKDPKDALDLENKRLQNQKLQREVAEGGSGGSGYKFTNDDRGQLIDTGLSNEDISALQTDLNSYGAEDAIAGLSENQKPVLKKILAGTKSSEQFLSKEYFRQLYGTGLVKAAKEAGFGQWLKFGDAEAEDFLSHLENVVTQYRQAGYSDQEILKMMQS